MSRVRRCWLGVFLAVGLLIVPVGAASAATKGYSLNVALTPGTQTYDSQPGVAGSGQSVSVTAAIANESGTQQLGSVNLFPPASAFDANFQSPTDGFGMQSVVSAAVVGGPSLVSCTSGGGVPCYQPASSCSYGTFSAPCLQLRNLALPPAGEVDVTMAVQTPKCEGSPTGTGFAWTAEVKQANNFSGTPGNDVPLDTSTSSVNTALDGACSLAFVSQPADALTGGTITDTAWTSPLQGGGPVTVQVLDQNGAPLTTFNGPVTMSLASNLAGATLSGDTSETPDGSGTASFSDLQIDQSGLYELGAASGTLTGTSEGFTIADKVASCTPGVTCQTTAGSADGNQSTISATSTGASGFLAESVNANGSQAQLSCAGYTTADPNTYQSLTTMPADEAITITITNPPPGSSLSSNPSKALKQQQICFGATQDFVTASGQYAGGVGHQPNGTLPDGAPGYIGLLPACSKKTTGPCQNVQQQSWVPDPKRKLGYDLILVLDVPAAYSEDPFHC